MFRGEREKKRKREKERWGAGGIGLLFKQFQKSDQSKRVDIPVLLLHKPNEKYVYSVLLAI